LDIEAMTGNIRIVGRHTRGNELLERLAIERKRFDGRVQSLAREIYDPGDGALILLYDPSRSRVVLVRQFRLPAFLRRGHESPNEVCAGKLEGKDVDSRISKEAKNETEFLVRNPRRVFEAYMNPGCFGKSSLSSRQERRARRRRRGY
jgi:nudix-type nucleoside diphosphatase (YffH/AdpP family)